MAEKMRCQQGLTINTQRKKVTSVVCKLICKYIKLHS